MNFYSELEKRKQDIECSDEFYPFEFSQIMPKPETELLPGVKWGSCCQLYTPAFWKFLYLSRGFNSKTNSHKLSSNILEEIVACMLGGYGMPSELGLLAFERLKNGSLIQPGVSILRLKEALYTPFQLGNGISKRYRFYNQKSIYIHSFLERKDLNEIPFQNDLSFRKWLLSINGIGFKTASWITRNWLDSENVAILDIHIFRAGKIVGIFKHDDVSKKYLELENCFISFCKAIDVRPSKMDAIIWECMKKTNKLALKILETLN